ncbi:DUF896 domain-containing protein [Oscillospiraceae bacterium CM]|nr:DUF896 domain-containing protein [Oscillospiraceae bacterium CM]
MEQVKIDRLNELARKAKTTLLTDSEKEEQKALRAEYLCAVRACLEETLDNTVIERPDGTKEKLKRREQSS